MDHFLYIHYNQVSDQASYKKILLFQFWDSGVLLFVFCWVGVFFCVWVGFFFNYSYSFLKIIIKIHTEFPFVYHAGIDPV